MLSTTPSGLQDSFCTVSNYASRWRLTYNATKSTIIVFRKGKQPSSEPVFTFCGTIITRSPTVKYGGILFSADLSCKDRVFANCQKARQTINSLSSLGLNSNGLHPATCVNIWKRMVLPTSFYGCEIMPTLHSKAIDLVENTRRYFATRI